VIAGWTAVGAVLATAGLLAVLTFDDGDHPSRIDTGSVVAEHGSVRAIEHRDDLAVQRREAMSRTVAEHGSVSAIEHRDQVAGPRRDAMSRTVAEHGSVSAIEHRDDLAAVAPIARAKGWTGLSPASIRPADRPIGN
jgi:hypothetical protein